MKFPSFFAAPARADAFFSRRSGLRSRALPVRPVIASNSRDFLTDRDAQMSVDKDTVRRIARLARLAVPEARLEPMAGELNGIFQWVEMLNEVDVEGIPAMTSVVAQKLKWRKDEVTDGGVADALMRNAPEREDSFFVVPKVVE
jgi:aspartyl-tRNA(Asn)/glutamyl-tRNA(Gln) amidotransferase subunit C